MRAEKARNYADIFRFTAYSGESERKLGQVSFPNKDLPRFLFGIADVDIAVEGVELDFGTSAIDQAHNNG